MKRMIVWCLAVGLLVSLGTMAFAQKAAWGTSAAPGAKAAAASQTLDIFLTANFPNASYGTGGTAMRNLGTGNITISGVGGAATAAYLYWTVLPGTTTVPKGAKTMTISRTLPLGVLPRSVTVTGTLIGQGTDPCWGSAGAFVYRAAIPTNVVTGNGEYKVKIKTGGSGLTNAADPWVSRAFPLLEGASLVVIGPGSAHVGLLDGMAGLEFQSAIDNYYQLPATAAPGNTVLFDAFSDDGQKGTSRTATSTGETTFVAPWNGSDGTLVQIAGPGAVDSDSDFDGSSGWPLPQLWDDTAHNISSVISVSNTTWIHVYYHSPNDCMNLVGAVVSVQ